MKKETGGAAFPKTGNFNEIGDACYDSVDFDGMTLRDYFAAKFAATIVSKWNGSHTFDEGGISYNYCAEQAYLLADAMLKARSE